jgi:Nuclear transport factor 2 (NTF2) domain
MLSNIDNIHEPKIREYFAELNTGRFLAAAELFADQGCLSPPFEKSIQGREAIAQYLENEAKGMRFCPERGQILTQNNEQVHYQIQGKVETKWFTVNVSWSIQLNSVKKITAVEVSLLASLTDLLHLDASRSLRP